MLLCACKEHDVATLHFLQDLRNVLRWILAVSMNDEEDFSLPLSIEFFQRACDSEPFSVLQNPDVLGVLFAELLQNLRGAVCTSIVQNDDFEIIVGLPEHPYRSINDIPESRCFVMCWYEDGDG